MRRRRFFVRRVKATNTGRPALGLPTAIMRSSSSECFGSGAMRGAFLNSASISAMETPCFWHFARLPPSQSNPVTRKFIIAVNYANVYTNAKPCADGNIDDQRHLAAAIADVVARCPAFGVRFDAG